MRTRNLAIPRCAIAHLGSGPSDHPGMTAASLVRRRPALGRYLERRKIKTGCDRTAHQGPVAGAFGSLPRVYGDNGLRHFARGDVRTKPDAALAAIVGNLQAQRVACIIMPDLHRIDAMPVRAFAPRQQEMDRGGQRTSAGVDASIAKSLAIMPAFRMRLQLEPLNDVGGGGQPNHQDLFLRSRNSPNTSAALLPFIRTPAATEGSSARRNTFAFFSSPSSVGTVGLLSARSRFTSSARAFSAALSGSMVSANLTLAAVYSWPQ